MLLSQSGQGDGQPVLVTAGRWREVGEGPVVRIGLPADVGLGLVGGVDPGDLVVVRPGAGITLPAGIVMLTGSTQSLVTGNLVSVRFCNVTNSSVAGFSSFPLRWFALKPW